MSMKFHWQQVGAEVRKRFILGLDYIFFLFCGALQEGYLPVVRLETLHTIHTVQVYYSQINKHSNVGFIVLLCIKE
jgi:hypothetical protein